ncbi:MAG: hypothetical protein WD646_13445 [Actinomycetota bacterium]
MQEAIPSGGSATGIDGKQVDGVVKAGASGERVTAAGGLVGVPIAVTAAGSALLVAALLGFWVRRRRSVMVPQP